MPKKSAKSRRLAAMWQNGRMTKMSAKEAESDTEDEIRGEDRWSSVFDTDSSCSDSEKHISQQNLDEICFNCDNGEESNIQISSLQWKIGADHHLRAKHNSDHRKPNGDTVRSLSQQW